MSCIPRNLQAKKLGIAMGTPAFEIKALLKEHNVVQISSNFSLYGDISHRFIKALSLFSPRVEEYSIVMEICTK